jgi:hypothetical protein
MIQAAPLCNTVLASNVLSLNAGGGCTFGGLTFHDFLVSNASGGFGTAEVDLTNATLTTINGIQEVDLNFNPNLGTGTTGGTITDLHFAFQITGKFNVADLVNGGTNASIQEVICNLATGVDGGCLNQNQIFNSIALGGQNSFCLNNGPASGSAFTAACALGANNGSNEAIGATQAWVFKDISIGDPSTSHLTSFDQTFAPVPEPTVAWLLGSGLVGLGIFGRRRLKK